MRRRGTLLSSRNADGGRDPLTLDEYPAGRTAEEEGATSALKSFGVVHLAYNQITDEGCAALVTALGGGAREGPRVKKRRLQWCLSVPP